jgi:hypothetical protein
MLFVERRRVQRVRLIEPLRGTIGASRVFVIDVSLRGIRVAHQEPIGRPGDKVTLQTQWDGSTLTAAVRGHAHPDPPHPRRRRPRRRCTTPGSRIAEPLGLAAAALRAI